MHCIRVWHTNKFIQGPPEEMDRKIHIAHVIRDGKGKFGWDKLFLRVFSLVAIL